MKIEVQFFALCREKTGRETFTLELTAESVLADAREQVLKRFPDLQPIADSLLFAVDGEYAGSETRLQPESTVACFPPVSGG